MITRETDEDVEAKQEGNKTASDEIKTMSKASSSSTTSAASPWSRLKDPRIVRVSRAFGGKDRHSKVCTIRGLRDRRVRLSVPTAIQLYDLQDRLGLNQPSKVVDWLLNAAKHEIDELPPLPIIPGTFSHSLEPILTSHCHHHGVESSSTPQSNKGGHRIGASINWDDQPEPSGSNMWHSDALFRTKSKEVARGDSSEDKETWTRSEEGKQPSHFESCAPGAYFSSNHFFSRLDHSSSSSLGLLNSTMPYNSLIRWDPSHLSLSQSGNPGLAPHQEDFHNFGVVQLPSTVSSLPSGPQQVLVYHQPGTTTQPCFPPHITAAAEYAGGRPFHLLGTTTKILPSQNDRQEKQNEDSEFHSR